jgi:phosphomannomutase
MTAIEDGTIALDPRRFPRGVSPHQFDPSILREYDIRGTVGTTLGEADARALGRAFGQRVLGHGTRIAVGRDGRHSSPMLEAALVEGLCEAGAEVERIGVGPTPMLYFAVHCLGTTAGIMVTGSHNPPDQNGFKMVLGARPVFGEAIRALGRAAAQGLRLPGLGIARAAAVFDSYIDRLVRDCESDGVRAMTVAWDPGNGAAGAAIEAVVKRLPGRHVLLNTQIDGSFPAHHPDPTIPSNLRQLQRAIADERCDFGVAFDGDGDLLGVVDGEGAIIWGDQILTLFARDILARCPGSPIIGDVKASQTLYEEIARAGGKPVMWKSGHALLRSKLAETGGPLAGEMSGHFFFADRFYGHDDAIYAAIRFLGIASRSECSVAELRKSLTAVFNTPELRFPCPEARKTEVIAAVKDFLTKQGAVPLTIDGVRVMTPEGWWLLRASNTEAVLTARCEATSADGLARVKEDLAAALRSAQIEPPAM